MEQVVFYAIAFFLAVVVLYTMFSKDSTPKENYEHLPDQNIELLNNDLDIPPMGSAGAGNMEML